MEKVSMYDKPIHKYEDKNGRIVLPGDTLRFSDGSIEVVYLANGSNSPKPEYDLGINASNEEFLAAHPNYARELYLLSNFRRSEFEVISRADQ